MMVEFRKFEPKRRTIFVFGSNRQGIHGAGSSRAARIFHGAMTGVPEGPQGDAYGIITKELREDHPKVLLEEVVAGVGRFLRYATDRPELDFQLTAVGCGRAGFTVKQVAPMFRFAPPNVKLPTEFKVWLEENDGPGRD